MLFQMLDMFKLFRCQENPNTQTNYSNEYSYKKISKSCGVILIGSNCLWTEREGKDQAS